MDDFLASAAPPSRRQPSFLEQLRSELVKTDDGRFVLPDQLTDEQKTARQVRCKIMQESDSQRTHSPEAQSVLDEHLREYRASTLNHFDHIGRANELVVRDIASAANDSVPPMHETRSDGPESVRTNNLANYSAAVRAFFTSMLDA